MADSRQETLEWLYEVTRDSITDAPVDKRSPLIGQLRAITQELAEIDSNETAGESERNGLIDFQAALAERGKPTAKGPRSASH